LAEVNTDVFVGVANVASEAEAVVEGPSGDQKSSTFRKKLSAEERYECRTLRRSFWWCNQYNVLAIQFSQSSDKDSILSQLMDSLEVDVNRLELSACRI
jgi:hypothetical protein